MPSRVGIQGWDSRPPLPPKLLELDRRAFADDAALGTPYPARSGRPPDTNNRKLFERVRPPPTTLATVVGAKGMKPRSRSQCPDIPRVESRVSFRLRPRHCGGSRMPYALIARQPFRVAVLASTRRSVLQPFPLVPFSAGRQCLPPPACTAFAALSDSSVSPGLFGPGRLSEAENTTPRRCFRRPGRGPHPLGGLER